MFRDANTLSVASLSDLIEFFGAETAGTAGAPGGFADALWCGSAACESSLKEKTKATLRCLPLGKQDHIEGTCAICGAPAKYRALLRATTRNFSREATEPEAPSPLFTVHRPKNLPKDPEYRGSRQYSLKKKPLSDPLHCLGYSPK